MTSFMSSFVRMLCPKPSLKCTLVNIWWYMSCTKCPWIDNSFIGVVTPCFFFNFLNLTLDPLDLPKTMVLHYDATLPAARNRLLLLLFLHSGRCSRKHEPVCIVHILSSSYYHVNVMFITFFVPSNNNSRCVSLSLVNLISSRSLNITKDYEKLNFQRQKKDQSKT